MNAPFYLHILCNADATHLKFAITLSKINIKDTELRITNYLVLKYSTEIYFIGAIQQTSAHAENYVHLSNTLHDVHQ